MWKCSGRFHSQPHRCLMLHPSRANKHTWKWRIWPHDVLYFCVLLGKHMFKVMRGGQRKGMWFAPSYFGVSRICMCVKASLDYEPGFVKPRVVASKPVGKWAWGPGAGFKEQHHCRVPSSSLRGHLFSERNRFHSVPVTNVSVICVLSLKLLPREGKRKKKKAPFHF